MVSIAGAALGVVGFPLGPAPADAGTSVPAPTCAPRCLADPDPVPLPHVAPARPGPVPMPEVEPREPGPVPMPLVGRPGRGPVLDLPGPR